MKRTVSRFLLRFAGAVSLFLVIGALSHGVAFADQPRPWQLDFQAPVTPVAHMAMDLWRLLLYIITGIVLLVMVLIAYIAVRFRASVHPVPSRTTHNTLIEILWTVLPVIVLVVMAVPSFKLLYFQEEVPAQAMTLKVTGNQWYWHYAYPDNGNFGFDSYAIDDADLKPGQERLLDVDNEVVLPVDTNVRVQIAANDVMHSWFVPSLAVQKYAVPGHLNEVWVNIEREGVYYGECNQICGVNHAFMPIKIHAVSKADFAAWVAGAKKKFAQEESAPAAAKLALAQP
jgi:cytochrome c oxidase subunit 2